MITIVDAPARADDLLLLGTMVGSGYRTPPALVRRGDGQTLQLTPLLYQVLQAIDGRRTCAGIATEVREAMRRDVSPDMVATLVDKHLRPLGLLKLADGSEPPVKRSNPLLALKLKVAVTSPRATRRLTDPFRILFRPVAISVVLLGFLAVTWWVFFHEGLAPATYDAFQRPHLLLLVFVVTVLSGGFHEFGHAAAARYGGADPGVIGAGVYLVWPAFYTDVTDSYRLGRRGRLRTDLGGLYFNAVVVVLTFVWWYITRWDALLLVVATQILQMVQQLMPMLRFDGYHVLADLTGVPDLYHRIRPTLLGLLPHRWSKPENHILKPWARVVITAWVLVTIPMMAFMLLAMVTSLPRVLGTAWAAAHVDAVAASDAWRSGGLLDATSEALQVLAVALPVLSGLLILGRIGRRWVAKLVRWSRGSGLRRAAAIGLAAAAVTALSWAWAPRPGNYRPITPGEKGLLTTVLPAAQHDARAIPASSQRARAVPPGSLLAVDAADEQPLADGAPLQATFQRGQPLPTKSHPQLAMVLIPTKGTGAGSRQTHAPEGPTGHSEPTEPTEPTAPAEPTAPSEPTEPAEPTEPDGPWVFPFDKPLPPAEGDNQAGAYNTTDDSVKYKVAFALVWATGDEVLNVNEAHAYASCSNCVTVAVAFQVVLIMDNAHVVVPQNLSVAANYKCYQCITAAVASQLVLSVEEKPSEEKLLALGEVWGRLTEFGKNITTYSLSEISTQLDAFKGEIVAILHDAPPALPSTPTPTPTSTGTPTGASGEPSSSSSPDTPASPHPTSPSSSPTTSTSAPTSSPSSPDTSPSSPDTSPSSPDTSPSSPDTSPSSPDPSTSPSTTSPSTSSTDSPSEASSSQSTPEPSSDTTTATPPPEPEVTTATDPSPSP